MITRDKLLLGVLLGAALLAGGCASSGPKAGSGGEVGPMSCGTVFRGLMLSREKEDRILALDPQCVTGQDVAEVLTNTPAPRIVNIHGGIYPVYLSMKYFSEFLEGMGYPASAITNPGNGRYSFSCYESSKKIAGAIAWYYEREGLRPIMVGHSQGGMQAVKVLYRLAGPSDGRLKVYNPVLGRTEDRTEITDPLSGQPRPVVRVQVSYATSVGAGGFTRLLPNQWDMAGRLRRIPDSVVEFTGFYMGLDLFGGDFFGFGNANSFDSRSNAVVRNVRLPTGYDHVTVPSTRHLLKSQAIKDWINRYQPVDAPKLDEKFDSNSSHILWAADVWFSIKKHWVQELQRAIRAGRSPKASSESPHATSSPDQEPASPPPPASASAR